MRSGCANIYRRSSTAAGVQGFSIVCSNYVFFAYMCSHMFYSSNDWFRVIHGLCQRLYMVDQRIEYQWIILYAKYLSRHIFSLLINACIMSSKFGMDKVIYWIAFVLLLPCLDCILLLQRYYILHIALVDCILQVRVLGILLMIALQSFYIQEIYISIKLRSLTVDCGGNVGHI